MIVKNAKGTIVRVTTPHFVAKLCKRAPHGRQSVQLAPAPGTTPSHVYFRGRWEIDPAELDGCSMLEGRSFGHPPAFKPHDESPVTSLDRWNKIDEELAAIREGKVVDGDPAAVESELLLEQDELGWEAGEEYLDNDNLG